jgi:hypothetical protein
MDIFKKLGTETVTLVKKDGQRHEIAAHVQADVIFTQDMKAPIETGDEFERRIPGGILERFIVTEPGYQRRVASLPEHYQAKVRKLP